MTKDGQLLIPAFGNTVQGETKTLSATRYCYVRFCLGDAASEGSRNPPHPLFELLV